MCSILRLHGGKAIGGGWLPRPLQAHACDWQLGTIAKVNRFTISFFFEVLSRTSVPPNETMYCKNPFRIRNNYDDHMYITWGFLSQYAMILFAHVVPVRNPFCVSWACNSQLK